MEINSEKTKHSAGSIHLSEIVLKYGRAPFGINVSVKTSWSKLVDFAVFGDLWQSHAETALSLGTFNERNMSIDRSCKHRMCYTLQWKPIRSRERGRWSRACTIIITINYDDAMKSVKLDFRGSSAKDVDLRVKFSFFRSDSIHWFPPSTPVHLQCGRRYFVKRTTTLNTHCPLYILIIWRITILIMVIIIIIIIRSRFEAHEGTNGLGKFPL